MSRPQLIINCLLFFLALLCAIWFYVRDKTIIDGAKLYDLREELKEEKRKTQEIRNQILYYSSYQYIASRAADEGYIYVTPRVLWKTK